MFSRSDTNCIVTDRHHSTVHCTVYSTAHRADNNTMKFWDSWLNWWRLGCYGSRCAVAARGAAEFR